MSKSKDSVPALRKALQNRIVGYDVVDPEQLLANPHNFRLHPQNQQSALAGSIDEIGFVDPVIVNKATGNVVDGHLRVALALRSGERFIPVVYVDLSEDEERKALLLLDPIAAMAATDKDALNDLVRMVGTDDERVQDAIARIEQENLRDVDGRYTRNIEAPIYEPKGEKPPIDKLYDDTRTKALIAEIDRSNLPEDEKEFLRIAAQRHTVLDFKNIAEYYAQASPEMQMLMENSALVIIDFERAIELGYVRLSERVAAQYKEDYPYDSAE